MSEIRATTISDAAGTGPATLTGQYAAKAWVNFNGTGTVAIRESGNVSSITDINTGRYTANFTAAMPDVNFSGIAQNGELTTTGAVFIQVASGSGAPTTTGIGVACRTATTYTDQDYISISVTR